MYPSSTNIQYHIFSSYLDFSSLVVSLSSSNIIPLSSISRCQIPWVFYKYIIFVFFQSTIVIGTWGVCSHGRYVKIFTLIKRSCLNVMIILSPNDCCVCFTIVQNMCHPVNSKFLPLAVVICLSPAVDELPSTISSLLRRSSFESGFSFLGRAWTENKDSGAAFYRCVTFQGWLTVHPFVVIRMWWFSIQIIVASAFPLVSVCVIISIARLITLTMVMCLLPASDELSLTISSLLRRSAFE